MLFTHKKRTDAQSFIPLNTGYITAYSYYFYVMISRQHQ